MCKVKKIRLASNFSTPIQYNKRKGSKMFKKLKKRKCKPRISYPEKLTFKYKVYW